MKKKKVEQIEVSENDFDGKSAIILALMIYCFITFLLWLGYISEPRSWKIEVPLMATGVVIIFSLLYWVYDNINSFFRDVKDYFSDMKSKDFVIGCFTGFSIVSILYWIGIWVGYLTSIETGMTFLICQIIFLVIMIKSK